MISPADNLLHAVAAAVATEQFSEAAIFAGPTLETVPLNQNIRRVMGIAASVAGVNPNANHGEIGVEILTKHFQHMGQAPLDRLTDGTRGFLTVAGVGVEYVVRQASSMPTDAFMVRFSRLDGAALAGALTDRVAQLEARVAELAQRPSDSPLDRLSSATADKLERYRSVYGLATRTEAAQRLIEQGLNGVMGRMPPDVGPVSSEGDA